MTKLEVYSMGALLVIPVIILFAAIVLTGIIMAAISLHRANRALDSSGLAALPNPNPVTLTGTETLTNKTLTSPLISRMISTGSSPTIGISGSGTSSLAAPSLASGSTDLAGIIACDGTGVTPGGGSSVSITLTYSVPYATRPASVIVIPVSSEANTLLSRPVILTMTAASFTLFMTFTAGAIPSSGGSKSYWNYLVVG